MNNDAKVVFLTVAVILMIGIVMIYSASAVYAFGKYGDSLFFVKRHIMYVLMGLAAAAFCMSIPPGMVRDNSRLVMLAALGLLFLVLIPHVGSEVAGARRWIRLPGFGFQPSEFAKFALIIYLADFTARKRYLIQNLWYGFIPPLFVTGMTGGLIFIEPDMGTAVAVLFIGFMMLFVSGAKVKHLLSVAAPMVPAMVLAVICAPYRFRRIIAFCNPWKEAKGAGFQLIQSFIALGSGGLIGVGLGQSKQKLFYLPESHTDFIFAIIGEELGFIGAASVLILFALLVWFMMRAAFRIKDLFMSRVVMGVAVLIAFETIVNIGVSTGMFPTKGLPLPFVSYGGSSLVAHMAAIGLVLNLSREAGK
jgi:cell division protein FtsW